MAWEDMSDKEKNLTMCVGLFVVVSVCLGIAVSVMAVNCKFFGIVLCICVTNICVQWHCDLT